jgi:outer membrane immunogenic protein
MVSVIFCGVTLTSLPVMAGPFSGLYVGVQVGHDNAKSETSWTDGIGTLELDGFSGSGIEGGAFVGYGGLEGQLYWGAEAFAGYSSAEFNASDDYFSVSTQTEMGLNYGVAMRLGVVATDNVLFYAKALLQNTNFEQTVSPGGSGDKTLTGIGVGGGIEVALWPKTSLRLEYSHTSYEDFSQSYLGLTETDEPALSNASFGLSYRL